MAINGLKSMCVDILVFFSVLTLIGHVSIDVWQRFVVNSELTSMKTSLNSLKSTLNNILTAYDKLDKDLTTLKKVEKASLAKDVQSYHTNVNYELCKKYCHINNIPRDKGFVNKGCSVNEKPHDVNYRNESTITRYPLQSKGIGRVLKDKQSQYKAHGCDGHNCHGWKF